MNNFLKFLVIISIAYFFRFYFFACAGLTIREHMLYVEKKKIENIHEYATKKSDMDCKHVKTCYIYLMTKKQPQ